MGNRMTDASSKKAVHTAHKRTAAAQERLNQIVAAAVHQINDYGVNGMSLQAVADEVGITQAGVLHYVGNKHGLLVEVIQHYYDRSSNCDDYLSLFKAGGAFEGQPPKIPEYCRLLVAENSNQPELVMLFQTLNTEAMSAASPLHEYFNKRSRDVVRPREGIEWKVPAGIDAEDALSCAMAAMYGLEGRWVARPDEIDYPAEWARFEDVLFPLPLWEGCR